MVQVLVFGAVGLLLLPPKNISVEVTLIVIYTVKHPLFFRRSGVLFFSGKRL